MKKEIHQILDLYREEMVGNLQKFLQIHSVASGPEGNYPFGSSIQEALDFIISLGKEKGFECINFDNFAAEINFGEGKESVGAISHLDVVPEGSGWSVDPFGGEIKGGKIYGRGAVDDKGPLIAVFYACLAIKESGLPIRKKIKQIIGTNEEGGLFPCLKYYLEHGQVPGCGIVPDAWFPAVYGEKGFLNYRFFKQGELKEIPNLDESPIWLEEIQGGEALNVVAPSARAVFRMKEEGRTSLSRALHDYPERDRISIRKEGDRIIIEATGKSAHASTPELGINAISLLLRLMGRVSFYPQSICNGIHGLAQKTAGDTDGSGLGIQLSDDTGDLTNNLGRISWDGSELSLFMNLRSPVSVTPQMLDEKLKEQAESIGFIYEHISYNPPFYISPDHPMVNTLTGVYQEMTGDMESKPKAHGAGSYARMMENFVPFGPSMQGEELTFHKQDENISVDRLMLLSKIYAEALYSLAQ